MINKLAATAATGAVIAATALTVASPAHATEMYKPDRGCSVASLRGAYAGNISGFSSTGPFNLQALTVFHGDGTAAGTTVTLADESGVSTFSADDSYTMNDDCTGTLTAVRTTGETVHYVIVLVDGGKKLAMLQTDPGYIANGAFDRVGEPKF